MKVKEITRTANVTWSPKQQQPIYLAAGTAAQQLDATFSTSAALEIYHVDLASKDLEMPVVGSMPSDHRFHKLVWSNSGIESDAHPNGIICGGTDNGEVLILDAESILLGNHEDAILHTLTDHSGPVQALDLNKHQINLLATGAGGSEIYIWDINKPVSGLTPGPRTSPPDQINCVQWNHQVQHILASSSQTGRVVVWDLRKSEAIIKVGDQSAMFHYKSIAWHPEVATQMLIGNEDDRYPVIQMWDLRFAASPMKVFEGHTRGILSLAWCPQDTDLLMSCGKDNRILCWNPNSQLPNGEIIYELPTTAQWSSDVSWCPRNPGLISTTAFDGHVTISTLMGGSQQMMQQQNSQVSDSFGISQDPYPKSSATTSNVVIEPLKKPPKWMRSPCGAKFGFGGKLISFGSFNEPGTPQQVHVSQVVTDPILLQKSHELESALLAGQFLEFCDMKINLERDPNERLVWQFLKCNFHGEPRMEFLKLLGYDCNELSEKISSLISGQESSMMNDSLGVNAAELAMKMEKLKAGELVGRQDPSSGGVSPYPGNITPSGSTDEGAALFDAIAQGSISQENPDEDEVENNEMEPFSISTNDDTDGLICQALLTGNYEAAVDVCFSDDRYADGLLLAIASGPDLFARTQKLYLTKVRSSVSKVISAVVNRDWKTLVDNVVIDNWKEALSMLVTYSKANEFAELCCILGDRLEIEAHDHISAMLCYICAGDVEKMVGCWTRSRSKPSSMDLQNLIEKVMILKKSVEHDQYEGVQGMNMSKQLCNYATLLSSQGNLQTSMMYLCTVNEENVNILKDRVFQAHGNLQMVAPEHPFQRVDVRGQSQHSKQTQQKATSPTYEKNHHQQFLPPDTQQQAFFTPSSQSTNPTPYYNSVSSPLNNHNPMYQRPPTHSMAQPSADMSSTYSNVPQSASLYSQNYSTNAYNQPQPPPAPSQPLQPGIYNPVQSTAYNSMPPTHNHGHHPEFAVPPPSAGHPMSLKAAKQSTPSPTHPTQEYNLYNPAANIPTQPQPFMPGNPGNPGMIQPFSNMPPVGGVGMPAANPESTLTPHINAGIVPPRNIPGQTQTLNQQPKQEPRPAPKEIAKGPIPSEHVVLKQTFDGVLEKCRNASNNPQTKRKIDDVCRKLEILYDLLRAGSISQNVLNGLHQMAQACHQADYMLGIQTHTHMITTGNFSEISSFMPGLKTLMQLAGQLKV